MRELCCTGRAQRDIVQKSMKATLQVINRMQAEGVIGEYAIGGAVGATFYLEPSATLDIDPAEYLVAISLGTGRPKDFARVLQFVESGVLNRAKLDSILRRHGLLENWERFRATFLRGSP